MDGYYQRGAQTKFSMGFNLAHMISLKSKPKIFCLSSQRTGTTSVGQFFKMLGYPVADWKCSFGQAWSQKWYNGDFEAIFNDPLFKKNQVFEDDPWWLPEFYKVLYHRFPKAKFILFTRPAADWFDSIINHSGGKTTGNTLRHSKVYRRESEFYEFIQSADLEVYNHNKIDNLLYLEGKREHYESLYVTRNFEIEQFFKEFAPHRLFTCSLYDQEKWQKLGAFVGENISDDFDVHANKS